MPRELYSDWQVYKEILFHIMQNSFKFSKDKGEIKITVVYCPFARENPRGETNSLHSAHSLERRSSSSISISSDEVEQFGEALTQNHMGCLLTVV